MGLGFARPDPGRTLRLASQAFQAFLDDAEIVRIVASLVDILHPEVERLRLVKSPPLLGDPAQLVQSSALMTLVADTLGDF